MDYQFAFLKLKQILEKPLDLIKLLLDFFKTEIKAFLKIWEQLS